MTKRVTFQTFCDEFGGAQPLSRQLGVSDRIIYDYYNRKCCPSVKVMVKLVSLSLGRLDYNAIVNSCHPFEPKAKGDL